jgi:serine phosphatase RsbU (regulator of sigma subunit)
MQPPAVPPPVERSGIPLSVRLILTTAFLVAGAVFAAAWFAHRTIQDLAAREVEVRRAEGNEAIRNEAELLARNVAFAASVPVAGNALNEVEPLLRGVLEEHDHLGWLLVVLPEQTVLAATPAAPAAAAAAYDDPMFAELARARPGTVQRAGGGTEWVYGTAIRSGDLVVGQLRVGVSTRALEDALARGLAEAAARAAAARRTLLLVAATLLAVGILLSAMQGLRIARPLRELAEQAARIAGGDLDRRVPEGRGDELGQLARNFNFMAGRLGTLLAENAEKASLEHEMALARQVQQSMLPATTLVAHGAVRVIGHCAPASSCGGDWWTYRPLSGGRTLVVIGDATGHGVHSALLAATARGAVEALGEADERLLGPEPVLRAIHAAIKGVGEGSMLMTCFAAVLDPAARTLHYANAGQNFPYVLRRGADGMLGDAQIIAASGNPLGDPRIPHSVRRGAVPMHPGDVLVTFSDGIVERSNAAGKLFGDRRLRAVFRGQRVDTPAEVAELRDRVVHAVEAFAEGTVAADDATFVLAQLEPGSQDRATPARSA